MVNKDSNPAIGNNSNPLTSQVKVETEVTDIYDDESTDAANDKPYKVKAIRAVSRISSCLNENWYSFEFSETREILDDSKISEIRADLWNTVNGEVDNQVQYTIDSILGKVPVAPPPQQPQNMNPNQGPVIPAQYDY